MNKLIFTNEELAQGSDLWLDKRKGFIGASDLSCLTGDSAFSTPLDLFERKLGIQPPIQLNDAMRRGQDLEEEARLFIQKYLSRKLRKKLNLQPIVAINPDYPDLMCSFDAVDINNKVFVEIKCQSENNFTKTVKKGIPSYYIPQVMAQACTAFQHWQVKRGFFCSYYPTPVEIRQRKEGKIVKWHTQLSCYPVKYDVEYCKYLGRLTKAFQEMVRRGEYNPFWDII